MDDDDDDEVLEFYYADKCIDCSNCCHHLKVCQVFVTSHLEKVTKSWRVRELESWRVDNLES